MKCNKSYLENKVYSYADFVNKMIFSILLPCECLKKKIIGKDNVIDGGSETQNRRCECNKILI